MARGHLRKRAEGSWSLVIELPRDEVTGKRHQKWVTFRGNKRDAEKELARLVAEADRGRLMASPNATVAEYLERWLKDHAEASCAPSTLIFYRHIIDRYISPYIGKAALEKLKPTQIVRLYSQLREAPRQDGNEGTLSASTRRSVHRTLHAALGHAVKWGLIPYNPVDAVDAPRAEPKEMLYFSAEQAASFLRVLAAEGYPWKAFFSTAITTGMRLGELRALRWADVDLQRGTLIIKQSVQRLPGVGMVVKAPKTAGSRRSVALGPEMVRLLREHRARQNEERLRLGELWTDNGLVFPSERGTYAEKHTVHRVFTRLCAQAEVPRIRIHDLRHTTATLLLAQGITLKAVSERLGHANPTITLQTYAHVSATLQREAAQTMDVPLRGSLAPREGHSDAAEERWQTVSKTA